MRDSDRPAFARALFVLGEVFAEPVSELRSEAYFDALQDLDIVTVLTACRDTIRTHKFFPRPAEIRDAIDPPATSTQAMAEAIRVSLLRQGWKDTQ